MSRWFVSFFKTGEEKAIERNDFAYFDRRKKTKNNY